MGVRPDGAHRRRPPNPTTTTGPWCASSWPAETTHWNTFVPNDADGHEAYMKARNGVHRERKRAPGDLLPVGGFAGVGSFGFAPELSGVHSMFQGRVRAAVVGEHRHAHQARHQGRSTIERERPGPAAIAQRPAVDVAGIGTRGVQPPVGAERLPTWCSTATVARMRSPRISVRGRAVMMTGDRGLAVPGEQLGGSPNCAATFCAARSPTTSCVKRWRSPPTACSRRRSWTRRARALDAADDIAGALGSSRRDLRLRVGVRQSRR